MQAVPASIGHRIVGNLALVAPVAEEALQGPGASQTEVIEGFFARFEAAFNQALIESGDLGFISNAFAESFVAANSNGIACWRNDGNLPAVMRQGFEFYRAIGAKSARITALSIMLLDDCHCFVKARWEMLFTRKGGDLESVIDEVFYLVQDIDNDPRIFSYITPDERALFRERGLIRSS